MISIIGIYCITNLVNNKLYIGQSMNVSSRLGVHKRSLKGNYHKNKHLQSAFNKYGEDSFDFKLIHPCTSDNLDELEREYISLFNTTDKNYGYNSETGGHLNKKLSLEHKAKISKAHKGKKMSEEAKKKMSENHYNCKGENNPRYGKHLSKETRHKISNSLKGRTHSDKTRNKMSNSRKGKLNHKWVGKPRIIKGGFSKNNKPNFRLIDANGNWVKDSVDRKKLEMLLLEMQ